MNKSVTHRYLCVWIGNTQNRLYFSVHSAHCSPWLPTVLCSWLAVVPLLITNIYFLLPHPPQPLVSYYILDFHQISFLNLLLMSEDMWHWMAEPSSLPIFMRQTKNVDESGGHGDQQGCLVSLTDATWLRRDNWCCLYCHLCLGTIESCKSWTHKAPLWYQP